jgi:hypothetical protein
MIRQGRRWIAGAVAAPLVVAASFAGCSSSAGDACDCTGNPQITITVPPDIATSVMSVKLSGPACTGVQATCANQTNGCTAYDFTPNAAGECDIEVDEASTTYTNTVTIISQTGCCAGFYPSTPGGNTVAVPEPDDAG